MKEEIYINQTLMDVSSDTNITLVYQSPLFTDPNYILNHRTNSVNLPTTETNLKAIGYNQSTYSNNKYASYLHAVTYVRDGVKIFDGWGNLASITPKHMTFCIRWGNINTFRELLNLRLKDIKPHHISGHIPWTQESIKTNELFKHNIDFGVGGQKHPVVKVADILKDIERQSNIKIEGKELFDKYYMPITRKKADMEAKKVQGMSLGKIHLHDEDERGTIDNGLEMEFEYCTAHYIEFPFLYNNKDENNRPRKYNDGLLDVSEFSVLRIDFTDYKAIPIDMGELWVNDIRLIATTRNEDDSEKIFTLPLKYDEDKKEFIFIGDKPCYDIDISTYKYIRIARWRGGTSVGSTAFKPEDYVNLGDLEKGDSFFSSPINFILDPDEEQEVLFGGDYPLYYNLPDWSVSEFLKNLIKLEGVFVSCKDYSTISFISVDDLYQNKGKTLDITDTIMLEQGLPSELTFSLSDFAMKNNFKYADDKTLTSNYSSYMSLSSEFLIKEKDLISVGYAGTDMYNSERGSIPYIPIYSKGDDGSVTYTDVTPRILCLANTEDGVKNLTFKGLEWENIIKTKYKTYHQCISHPRVLKVSAIMVPKTLASLDLSVPVYCEQLGHYYAILTLTTKEKNKVDMELLELTD